MAQLEEVSHNKGISITPSLVNKDADTYSNMLKGAHNGPIMDIPTSNAQKLALKEKACSSTNVEGQHDQLGGVASFGYSKVQQCKDIPTTSLLLINDSKKAEGQAKCPSPIIPEIAPTTYCNVLKGDSYGYNMEGLIGL
ncbi:hypothetical protein LWI28_016583 [Acer negundo]|uniref:Uncharacterized protein n=1 Tax=Acer negundo TaxID=4023 RepID=A0AAD5IV55_ACENE|nr:hypothetical protein LWI28_016583 [Acer negundo]